MKRTLAHVLAAFGGAAAWVVVCRTSGQAEAWDDGAYLQAALPALGAFAALLGFWLRERVGMLGVAASFGQIAGLSFTRGQHEMWPLDLGILAAQALPFGLCAVIGGGLRRLLGGALRAAGRGARIASWPMRRLLAGYRRSVGHRRSAGAAPPALPDARRDDHPAARRMLI